MSGMGPKHSGLRVLGNSQGKAEQHNLIPRHVYISKNSHEDNLASQSQEKISHISYSFLVASSSPNTLASVNKQHSSNIKIVSSETARDLLIFPISFISEVLISNWLKDCHASNKHLILRTKEMKL